MADAPLVARAPHRDWRGMAGCVLFIVIGVLAILNSRDYSTLGSVFPRTVAALMIVLSVVYLAVSAMGRGAHVAPAPGSVWRRAAVIIVMLAWSFALAPVGFLTSSVMAYAALLVIANHDGWTPRRAVLFTSIGAAVLGVLYGVFRYALKVPLPEGWFL